MATVGNLLTTIIGDLGRGDTSLSDIVLIDVQSAITEYETQRFYFNEAKLSITLSATDTYALSLFAAAGSGVSDIIEVDWVNVFATTGRTYDLEEITAHDWDIYSGGGVAPGYPEKFAIYNQSLRIYPQALATGLTGNMFAHVKFTPIAAGGYATSNVWTNDGADLIRNAALKRLWARRFRDPNAAQICAMAERDALRALQRRTEALSNTTIAGYL